MLALLDYEASQCRGCGGYLPETTAPDAQYVAGNPGRCHRCTAMHAKQADYQDQKDPQGLVLWPVEPKKLKKTE